MSVKESFPVFYRRYTGVKWISNYTVASLYTYTPRHAK